MTTPAVSSLAPLRPLLAWAVLALLPSPLHAEAAPIATGTLAGEVVRLATGLPVAGATISVDGTPQAQSDPAGRFRIEGLAPGAHELGVVAQGFVPLLQPDVVIVAGRAATVSLRLPEPARLEEAVSVAASYFARPDNLATSSFSMSSEEVRRAPGALGDVSRVVQALPGLGARDDQRNDIVARGGSPSENLILVDGFEVPAISHFAAYGASGGNLAMIDAEVVGDARFTAGGFPAPYGNRLSAVLEVGLREGSRTRLQGQLQLGISGAGLVVEGPLGKRGSFLATARRSYLDLIAGPFGVRDVPEYSNYLVKASYELSPRHQLSLLSLGGRETIHEDVPLADLENADTIVTDYLASRSVTGLRLRSFFGTRAVGTLSLAHALVSYRIDSWDKLLDTQQVERNRTSNGETTARYDLVFERTGRFTARLGLDARRKDDALDLAQPLGYANPYSQDPARIHVVSLLVDRVSAQLGSYLDATARLGPAALTLGARYDYDSLTRASRVSPRAGLVVQATDRIELTAAAGRYTQVPPLALLVAAPGNERLSPIVSDHLVIGAAYRPRPDLRLSFEGYLKRYSSYPVSLETPTLTFADFGEQYDASFLMPMIGSGRGRVRGLELAVQKKLVRALWGQLSYAWSRSEEQALDRVWRPGSFDLPHVFSLVLGYRLQKGFEVSSRFSYSSGRPITPFASDVSSAQNRPVYDTSLVHGVRAPAYSRLDLRVDKRFGFRWGGLVLYVEAENLYDRENVRAYTWNPKTRRAQAATQLPLLVLGGFDLEF